MARILVVDDSATLRKVVASILMRHGHDADVAADGLEGIERLRTKGPYQLVLLDFVMPKMNGYQFCRVLREDEALCAQPVILMSAKSDKIRETFVRQTGALDAISKPFDAQALVVVVDNALRRVERGHQSQSRITLEPEEPVSLAPPSLEDTQARVAAALGEELGRALSSAPPPPTAPQASPLPAAGQPPSSFASTANVRSLAGSLESLLTPEVLQKLAGTLKSLEVTEPPPLLEGDLAVIPVGAVLQLIQMERLTGVLTVRRGDPPKPTDAPVEVTITMRLGLVDLAQSKGTTTDEFRLGRHFLEAGLTTPTDIGILVSGGELDMPPELNTGATPAIGVEASDLDDAGDHDTASFPRLPARTVTEPVSVVDDPYDGEAPLLGDQLLRYGRISKEQLKLALTRQSSELLYEVLRWTHGRFELRKKTASGSARRAKLGLAVPSVVMEGFRRVDEWRLLEKKLGSFDDVLLRDEVALSALANSGDDTIEKVERTVLEAIDAKRSIREVVAASHLSSFDACRVLVQLLEARLVRRTP